MLLLYTYESCDDIIYRVKIAGGGGNYRQKQVKRTFSRITNLGRPQSYDTISTRK